MKRFFKYVVIFLLPILVYLTILEILVDEIPNSYSFKYNYVKTKGDKIEAIAIGHSQLYDGFDPGCFKVRSFNLCNSAQHYIDNYYILKELLPLMPNLKMVIMPIGYMNATVVDNDEISSRSRFYYKYMGIKYDGQIPLKYRFECLNPKEAREKLFCYYRGEDMVRCDSLGRSHHEVQTEVKSFVYTYLTRWTQPRNRKLFLGNEDYFLKTIDLLKEKKITIILVSPPIYWGEYVGVNDDQQRFIKEYAENLAKKYALYYVDFESDTSFLCEDFFDEGHLNNKGAEKFTGKLNECLVTMKLNDNMGF